VIVQFNTIPGEVSFDNFGAPSNNRFFHDRFMSIIDKKEPVIQGETTGKDRSYVLVFRLSDVTQAEKIKIRGLNCTFRDIKPNFSMLTNWEVIIDVQENLKQDIFILFDCSKSYGGWKLLFAEGRPETPNPHAVDEWSFCRAAFEYIALIKVSEPDNDETMELPRFIISPKYSYEYINSATRGSVGQPYGRNIRRLKTLEVQYTRVKAYCIDEYLERVGLAVPHFIVPYPENVFNVSPFWGTLEEMPEFTKRAENNWYWNLSMNWKEAY
jgi:hypothetical protein